MPLMAGLLAGCASARWAYEEEHLVSVIHSRVTDYTLLVFRRESGVERRELRRGGVCVLTLIQNDRVLLVKERGREPQRLEPAQLASLEARIEALLQARGEEPRGGLASSE
jgi:hypothetical protein